SSLDETVIQHGKEFNIGIHKYEGDNYEPKGHKYVRDFEAETIPVTIIRVGGVVLRKERLLVENDEQVLIKYTLLEAHSPTILRFKPFLAFRNIHALSKSNLIANTKSEFVPNGIKSKLYNGYPYLHMQFSKSVDFIPVPDWYYNVEYLEEQKRGYDYKEDLFVPGYFELPIKKGESVVFSGSTKEVNPNSITRRFTAELKKRVPRDDFKNCLINSAQQFIVRKKGETQIIAGFPWFDCWGRDTFISLPGLTLSIDDPKTFLQVTDTEVKKLKGGLFPNMGSGEDAAYNSVDAPLWFFWAIQQYVDYAGSEMSVWKKYSGHMKAILAAYREGASFNIRMQENGLIWAGEEGKALTWMDAVVDGYPVTQRKGFAVEINTLWYNAVKFALELAEKAGDNKFVKEWENMPEKIKESFRIVFCDPDKVYLADYVDGDYKDWSVRPNQIFAVSFKYSPLDNDKKKQVLDTVRKELLTPRGLRTLSPKNPDYKAVYEGNQEQRDKAYHQGTVWPWLLGHFCEGYLKLHKKSGIGFVRQLVEGFEEVMSEHGIGSISEIYDGNPPHLPRGAISQAWSVAEILRILTMLEKY
ncbi:MAG: glycogen debranching enzyme family protein, partial [Bacteroidales bacterium]|nr:glycogen debranching enzyme family protein [Bacteroidales bacterium]